MADSKSGYSLAAKIFNKITRHSSMRDAISYLKSKLREEKFNEDWKKNMVDLNQIVNQFTPGAKGVVKGYKYEFRKGNYVIKVDMPSGYLRIFDDAVRRVPDRRPRLFVEEGVRQAVSLRVPEGVSQRKSTRADAHVPRLLEDRLAVRGAREGAVSHLCVAQII